MKPKYYYIKERHNPQFTGPYFVGLGNIKQSEAKCYEDTLYGYNIVHRYETKEAYEAALNLHKINGTLRGI